MSRKVRWGILGTGNIARQFADGLTTARRGEVVAVASRTQRVAEDFARSRGIGQALGNYEALLAEPGVDAVYISLPNSLHHEWTLKSLRAGKHVLCEKPFALDTAQATEMFDTATAMGRVLVEAFMYRSHPLTHAVVKTLRSGEIGAIRLVRTSFCYKTSQPAGNVRFVREMGGGGLMDVGSYCINFSRLIAGEEPAEVHAVAQFHERGVDDLVVATMRFPSGVMASFTCGMSVHADNTAYVCGSEGYIAVPVPWKPPMQQAVYTVARSTPPKMDLAAGAKARASETRTVDAPAELYALEADDFAAAVFDGAAPAVPAADTLGNMRVLDAMRQQIGLQF